MYGTLNTRLDTTSGIPQPIEDILNTLEDLIFRITTSNYLRSYGHQYKYSMCNYVMYFITDAKFQFLQYEYKTRTKLDQLVGFRVWTSMYVNCQNTYVDAYTP